MDIHSGLAEQIKKLISSGKTYKGPTWEEIKKGKAATVKLEVKPDQMEKPVSLKLRLKYVLDDLLVVKIPCVIQDDTEKNGAHSFENCKIFCKENNIKNVVAQLTNKEKIIKRVDETCKQLKTNNKNMTAEEARTLWRKYTKSEGSHLYTLSLKAGKTFNPEAFEKSRFNVFHKKEKKARYVNVIVPEGAGFPSDFVPAMTRIIQEKKNSAEILMILDQTINNWAAARVEKLENGDMAILYADSLSPLEKHFGKKHILPPSSAHHGHFDFAQQSLDE